MLCGVELREVRVFLTLAEELHFGHTAERLDITHARVSQTIRTLETRVGGRLFERTSRRVRLTALGAQMRDSITPAYEQLERALDEVRETAVGFSGALRIGTYSPINCGPHIVEIVETFTNRHPGCDVAFVDIGLGRDILHPLRAGEVDFLASRLPLTHPDVTVGPVLSREERVLVVALRDPLAQRESISYEELADRAVSDSPSVPRETMDAFVPPRTPSGRLLRRVNCNTVAEALMRAALGELVHPTVRSLNEYVRHPGIAAVPIRDLPPAETALVWLTANRSPKIEAFARAAEDALRLASV